MDKQTGELIVIEGLDGSGKHTQATLLQQYLVNKNHKTSLITFPNYSSPFGRLIRHYLDKKIDFDQFELNNLYSADRYYAKTILDDLIRNGIIVIADRYTPSNIAYGAFNGDTKERIQTMDQFLPQPDIIILVDIDPTTAMKRLEDKDRNEQNLEYLQKVRRNYLIEYYINQEKWKLIDGTEREQDIHKRIVSMVEEILK